MSAVDVVENLEFIWWIPLFIYACIFIPALLRIRKIHINLRILMCNVIVDCLLSVGSRLILRIMQRYGTVGTVDSSKFCTVFSFANVLFLISGTTTLLFLCLERYIATMRHKGYEHKGAHLAVFSLIVKYILSVALTYGIIFNSNDKNIRNTEYCSYIDYHPKTVIFIYCLGIVFFLSGLAITLFLYAYNVRKQKRIGDNLSTRFQFKENISATKMLRYQMECYFAISLVGAPVSVLNLFIAEMPDTQMLFDLLNQIPYILYLFYLTFYLLHVTFYYDPFFFALAQPLMTRFCCVVPLDELNSDSSKDRLTVDKEGDNYFQQFASMWGGPPEIQTVPAAKNVKTRPTKKMFAN